MWQSSGVKNKLLAVVRKREKERLKPHFHVKRVYADLETASQGVSPDHRQKVRLILNDMTSEGGGFFAQHGFAQGEQLTLRIHEPVEIMIHARVIWSQAYSTGRHVISSESYPYRVGVEFVFTDPVEKEKLDEFIRLVCQGELNLIRK